MDLFGKKSKKRLLELEQVFENYKNTTNLTMSNLNTDIANKNDFIQEISLQKKLITSLMNAKTNNKGILDYKSCLNKDFMEFANQENTLANEAEAFVKLQAIEKKLEIISSYPDIFTKNIIAVGGGFSAGKSEFISSFINDDEVKLPIGIEPTTAIPTYVISKDEPMILACNNQSASINLNEIDSNMYKKLSHKFINSFGFNLKQIMPYMVLGTKLKFDNICFIDTPGYNPSSSASDYTSEDLNTAKDYLKNASALIWLIGLDANGTIPKSDLDFLDELELDDKELYIVLNKADLKTKSDIAKIMSNVASVLDEYGLDYSGISAYSSLQKLEIAYDKMSLDEFLARLNKEQISVKESIYKELRAVKKMYEDSITNHIESNKKLYKELVAIENKLLDDNDLKNNFNILLNYLNTKQDLDNLQQLDKVFFMLDVCIQEFFGDNGYYKYKPKTKDELKALCNNDSINLKDIDTSLTTDMEDLFRYSKRKDFRGINTWNTSNVTNMSGMFYMCENLKEELEFDMQNVKNIRAMLYGCMNYKDTKGINKDVFLKHKYYPKYTEELKELCANESINLCDIDVSNITNMHMLFAKSTRKDFSGINTWDTSKVTDMGFMFAMCEFFNEELTFNTSKVTNMSFMFFGCKNFNKAINFDVSNAKLYGLLFGCTSYKEKLNFKTNEIIFYKYQPLTKKELKQLVSKDNINLSEIDTSKITDMSELFKNSKRVDFQGINNWDTSNVENMSEMFCGCKFFNEELSFDTSKVTDMSKMFYKCKIFNKPITFNTSKVKDMRSMFAYCESFNQPLDFDTSNVKNMSSMFETCKVFNQPLKFNTENVTDMGCMFMDCRKLNQTFSFDMSKLEFGGKLFMFSFSNGKLEEKK